MFTKYLKSSHFQKQSILNDYYIRKIIIFYMLS